ncbi:MAG: 4Fe-4S binding protein [Prolixibacteraceae bacterium]|jgi:hypothetical protein|nr:4Fe-4S binding protein [Prolixibacteraceae bacterium]
MIKRRIDNYLFSKLYIILMVILLLGVIVLPKKEFWGYGMLSDKGSLRSEVSLEQVKEVFKNASHYEVDKDRWIVFSDSIEIGWGLNTSPISDSIIGFSSSVPVFIGFDNHDCVAGIALLQNTESKDFIVKLKEVGFFDSWNNLKLKDVLNTNVDAITGATLTSDAVIQSINHRVGFFLNKEVKIPKSSEFLDLVRWGLGLILLISSLMQFFFPKIFKPFRILHQVLLIVILGFWLGSFLSVVLIMNWATYGVDVFSRILTFTILVISILLPLITNKAYYCSYMCPYGACQELMGKVRKKKIVLPSNVRIFLSNLREKIFAVLILLLLLGVSFDLTNIEPFSAFMFKTASIPVIILAVIFVILSIFVPRPWCNYFCPTGQFLEIIRKPIKNKS